MFYGRLRIRTSSVRDAGLNLGRWAIRTTFYRVVAERVHPPQGTGSFVSRSRLVSGFHLPERFWPDRAEGGD